MLRSDGAREGDAAGPAIGGGRGLILLYHRVAAPARDPFHNAVRPEHFRAHCRILAERCTVVPLTELIEGLRTGGLPPRAAAVTIDDGYRDTLDAAAPILGSAGVPATVFIASGYVGGARPFWWDELDAVVEGLGREGPDGGQARLFLWWDRLRRTAPERRDELLLRLGRRVGGVPETAIPAEARPLSRAELLRLAGSPGIDIGGHSVSHPLLNAMPGDIRSAEIAGGKRQLEGLLGAPITLFSYPFGPADETGPELAREVREAGYTAALTTRFAPASPGDDPLLLPRLTVGDWDARTFAGWLDAWHAADRGGAGAPS